jgi:hypothetical protein
MQQEEIIPSQDIEKFKSKMELLRVKTEKEMAKKQRDQELLEL